MKVNKYNPVSAALQELKKKTRGFMKLSPNADPDTIKKTFSAMREAEINYKRVKRAMGL